MKAAILCLIIKIQEEGEQVDDDVISKLNEISQLADSLRNKRID